MPDKQINGLVCGKFYPLHKGHDYLIKTALEHCEQLTIMIVQQPDQEPSGKLREEWLTKAYPGANVILAGDIYKDGDHQAWADYTIEVLDYAPDIVFSSESYGKPWSDAMDSQHMMVDFDREQVPISAEAIRKDPKANWEFINPDVQEYYTNLNSKS